jgi:uncharacterized protein
MNPLRLSLALLLSLITTAAAQQADRDPRPRLTVAGEAQVSAKPDRAVVTLGATAQADQAADAQQQINQVMTKAIDAIKQAGIAEDKIQTAGLSLYPVYSEHGDRPRPANQPQEPRIVGYRASNTIRITLDDITAVGPIIDAGITAGANQLEGVSFELKDDTAQRAEALKQAAANARQKANALAAATGVNLDSLHEIIEGGVSIVPPQPMTRHAAFAMETATPVQPGQVQIQAAVTLTYVISKNQVQDQ